MTELALEGLKVAPVQPAQPAQIAVLNPSQRLDIDNLRYPGEKTYLALIMLCDALLVLVAAVILINLDPSLLGMVAFIGLAFVAFMWFTHQLLYWWIYGNSVLVTPAQYPELYEAVSRACEYIDLNPPPDVFVFHGEGMLELFLLKRFTRRGHLFFTSELVDQLLDTGDSRQLMMLIGRQLGHIKAGHYRWWFFTDVLGQLTFLLHKAWWRRCHYTADRVGFLVAGDLDMARQALLTITVGKNLSASTNIDSIREQDAVLQGNAMARYRQLLAQYPYIIRRIIELESFRDRVRQRPSDTTGKQAVGLLPPEVSRFSLSAIKLRKALAIYFNEQEIRDLCFELSVDYEDLGGEGKSARARELTLLLERQGRLQDLEKMCRELRPAVAW